MKRLLVALIGIFSFSSIAIAQTNQSINIPFISTCGAESSIPFQTLIARRNHNIVLTTKSIIPEVAIIITKSSTIQETTIWGIIKIDDDILNCVIIDSVSPLQIDIRKLLAKPGSPS